MGASKTFLTLGLFLVVSPCLGLGLAPGASPAEAPGSSALLATAQTQGPGADPSPNPVAAAAAAIAFGAVAAPQQPVAQAQAPALFAELATPVDLTELRRQPGAWLGRPVRFVAQRAPQSGPYESLETGFDPVRWQRFSAWSEQQRPWRAADFANPAPYLFARTGSSAALLLISAGDYGSVELFGRVEAVCLGEPWIAIEAVQPLSDTIGEGVVLHASRALELLKSGQRRLALAELERALSAPLPAGPKAELEAEQARLTADLAQRPEVGPPAPRPGFTGEVWHLELVSPRLPAGP